MNAVINILLCLVFLALLVASFILINIYIKKFSINDRQIILSHNQTTKDDTKTSNNKTWISILSSKNITDFSYPSNELFITLDFSHTPKTHILTISNLDSYKFFCLNEILKNNNIQFAYQKKGNSLILKVALDNDNLKAKLIDELRQYHISYHIN